MIVSDRRLIEAAVEILSYGEHLTASRLSRIVRESHKLPHRCDRMADLMIAAAAEGVVRPVDRVKGCRSTAWTQGSTPLPDWFGRGPKPEPEPAVEPPADINAALGSIVRCLREIGARLDAIDGKLDDLAADTSSRPLFARRNGH